VRDQDRAAAGAIVEEGIIAEVVIRLPGAEVRGGADEHELGAVGVEVGHTPAEAGGHQGEARFVADQDGVAGIQVPEEDVGGHGTVDLAGDQVRGDAPEGRVPAVGAHSGHAARSSGGAGGVLRIGLGEESHRSGKRGEIPEDEQKEGSGGSRH
jgi:hypothetical protein